MTQDTAFKPTKLTIYDFARMYKHEDAKSSKGKVQLAQSGELYISIPRSGTKALISNLWANLNALFGNKDNVLRKGGIENKARQDAALEMFAALLDVDKLDIALKSQTNGEQILVGSPEFFKLHIETQAKEDNSLAVSALHKNLVQSSKLGLEKSKTLTSLPVPGSPDGINCEKLSPQERRQLVKIYNTLLDLHVAQTPMLDTNIANFNDVEIALLRQLGSNPALLNTAANYMEHTCNMITLMPYHKITSVDSLAIAKIEFSCWNTFWQKRLGIELQNRAMPDLLVRCANQQAINNLIEIASADKDSVHMSDFVFLCHSPSISHVDKEAENKFKDAQFVQYEEKDANPAPSPPPGYNDTAVERHEQDGVDVDREFFNEEAWNSFANLNPINDIPNDKYKNAAFECCLQSRVNDVRKLFNDEAWNSFARLCELNMPKTAFLHEQIKARAAAVNLNEESFRSAQDTLHEGITNFLKFTYDSTEQ